MCALFWGEVRGAVTRLGRNELINQLIKILKNMEAGQGPWGEWRRSVECLMVNRDYCWGKKNSPDSFASKTPEDIGAN